MQLQFINRQPELEELDSAFAAGGLLVIFGRRRIGKTRLLTQWLNHTQSAPRIRMYSQAIEASTAIQIDQVYNDIRGYLDTDLIPKTWAELFEIVALVKEPFVFCLDEFPYLVTSDKSLPSVLQRWLDHKLPKKALLILSGSSTRMMHDLVLHRSAPLYGRARKILDIRPMGYRAFCEACKLERTALDSITKFALVGGVPKYWEFVGSKTASLQLAEELFFGFSPDLDAEPSRILKDEGFGGATPLSLLEAVGRGAHRPSEVAARLNTPQTNLSRLFEQLIDASILKRELPFGESPRSTKRTLYSIQDPTLRFWFSTFSPHRTRWRNYSKTEKEKLLHDHASTVFEDLCREQYADAGRYWEKDTEFDFVREDTKKSAVVAEVKLTRLSSRDRTQLLRELELQWERCALRNRFQSVRFDVFDQKMLDRL
jgi:AAA+ ATPase superfamily predicted ATPase